jgi:hypothetical protein
VDFARPYSSLRYPEASELAATFDLQARSDAYEKSLLSGELEAREELTLAGIIARSLGAACEASAEFIRDTARRVRVYLSSEDGERLRRRIGTGLNAASTLLSVIRAINNN